MFFPITQFISGLIALIFQGQTYEFRNITNIQGALFILVTNMTFQSVFSVVNVRTTTWLIPFAKPLKLHNGFMPIGFHCRVTHVST